MQRFELPEPPKSTQETAQLWKAPPAAYRGKPFWSWNGKLELDELERQIQVFKEMGMGGFCMHSRTGLATEYLGKEWFNAINVTSDEGTAKGMEAWIYDEDRWPSGSAGGMATTNEVTQMKSLRCQILESGVIEWPEERLFLNAFIAELEDLNLIQYQSIDYKSLNEVGAQTVLIFAWEAMGPSSFYNGSTYLDTMDREAVEHYLKLTHDRYAQECGDRLGKAIPIVFTDEPHRGNVMPSKDWAPDDEKLKTPWTPKLPSKFREAYGYDLIEVLPEIYFRKSGEPLSPHKWRYMELIQQLFLDSWAKPCLERAHQYKLALTGHVFQEDTLLGQAMPQGSMARYYEYMDIPGVDVLGNDNVCFWIVKQLQSVGRQQNKPWLLSELYGCSGWSMSLEDHKRMGDWQALFGINVRCHHLSWYTMAGEAKRDYPASIFYQSAWWREYALVETYFSRLHAVLQAGTPVCDVLVVNPVETFWAQIHPDWSNWLEAGTKHLQGLQDQYEELFHWLQGNRIDFDYGDEDHLKRYGQVIDVNGTPHLELGAMRYRTVVVAGCETLRGTTMDLLESFVQAGGHIVFAGKPPSYVDAIKSPRVEALAQRSKVSDWSEAEIVSEFSAHSASSMLSLNGTNHSVLAQIRQLDDAWFVVLLNTGETESFEDVQVEFRGGESIEEWDSLTGEVIAHKSSHDGASTQWETQLPPLKERVFHIKKDPSPSIECEARTSDCVTEQVSGPFDFDLNQPNVLPLDYARLRIGDGSFSEPYEVLKIEEILCNRCGTPIRNGHMVQPWARTQSDAKEPGLRIELQFEFEIKVMPTQALHLMMEPIAGQKIRINGHNIHSLETSEMWVDPCFKQYGVPIDLLKLGKNTVSLEATFRDGVDLEALYLVGSFGVNKDPEADAYFINTLPDLLGLGNVCDQGLPFFSDSITYSIPVRATGRLSVTQTGAACVAFTGAGERLSIPWGDFQYEVTDEDVSLGYVLCEIILTRRNTFGPFHHKQLEINWLAPAHFRADGEEWTDEYILLPNGLESVSFTPAS